MEYLIPRFGIYSDTDQGFEPVLPRYGIVNEQASVPPVVSTITPNLHGRVSRGTQVRPKEGYSHGLVGVWLFNSYSGSVVHDYSLWNRPGSVTGGTWEKGGLTFDGTDDVVTVGDVDLTNVSVAVGVIGTAAPGTGDIDGPVMKDTNYALFWNHTTGASSGAFGINDGAQKVASFGTLTAGQYYNLVGTFDGSNIKSYLDGNLVNTTACGAATANNNNLLFGKNSTLANFWAGQLFYVYLWDRALTAAEAMRLHINPYRFLGNTEVL